MKTLRKNAGFTLAELMISVTVLALLITFSASVYINFFGSMRNIRAANGVYEEARFAMERMVKEVRNGTVDYEEYYNQDTHFFGSPTNETYGQNYCEYSRQFYGAGKDEVFGTTDDESVGLRNLDVPAAVSNAIQPNLYLININGTRRTYLKRFEREVNGRKIGRVGILELEGRDYGIDHISQVDPPPSSPACPLVNYTSTCSSDEGEKDGRIDTWFCAEGFCCGQQNITGDGGCTGAMPVVSDNSFVDITPISLDVTSLQFIITPPDDPRKAYNDATVQIQPQVTIRLTARANAALTNEFRLNSTPSITLESSVSARVYNEIVTECNLRECLTNQTKVCPKTLGVCASATQSCNQGVWPGCSTETYAASAGAGVVYEPNSETASCNSITDPAAADACKFQRCTDGVDNDCNGLADNADPACLIYLCNNGQQDDRETYLDVGGICDFIRPVAVENNTTLCSDGYDNDGNGLADEFDPNCVQLICNNGKLDPPVVDGIRVAPFFVPSTYATKNYLLAPGAAIATSDLNEAAPDVGGLCNAVPGHALVPTGQETAGLCYDGLDNDNNGFADELDGNCKAILCNNGQLDCGLVDRGFTPANMLSGYSDPLCSPLLPTNLDEGLAGGCPDVGGICGGSAPEDSASLCFDGKDNDCSGKKDGDQGTNSDPLCCPDTDVDGFSAFNTTCHPARANALPPNGAIDCNNLPTSLFPVASSIFPGAPEVCDDAIYPTTIAYPADGPQAGQPIDNNCSFANGVTIASGWDHDDPKCCVDADVDGYGPASAYIYRNNQNVVNGTILCGRSAFAHSLGTESFDCNDLDPNINPGIPETGALCNDGIDNNCNNLIDSADPGCAPPPMPPEPTP